MWKPVTDPPPLIHEAYGGFVSSDTVLVTDGRHVAVGFYYRHGDGEPYWAVEFEFTDITTGDVTHWMPLPAPPAA